MSLRSPFWLICGWSLLLLANFLPTLPQPVIIIGYLWKVEFALAALIFLTLIFALKFNENKITFIKSNRLEIRWIIIPLFLFTFWSGLSCFWAQSPRNALHHTLLWACFSIFYLLVRQIISQPRLLNSSLKCAGLVFFVLGLLCCIEYLSTSAENSVNISLRYSKYAEALATLLPIFIALAISKKNRSHLLFGIIGIVTWLGIILSLGRTQFLSGLLGIFVFTVISVFVAKREIVCKRAFILCGIFVFITIFSQLSAVSNGFQQTTVNRFSDQQSQTSFQVRVLVWQITLESFEKKPFFGVGADNFITNYKSARENYAESESDSPNIDLYEEFLPERVHNEYLQILSELGIIGIFFFGWFLFGIGKTVFTTNWKSASLLSIASWAGIVAFLVSSIASSYSFRVPANGVCFFFILAIAAGDWRQNEKNAKEQINLDFWRLKPVFISVGLIICLAMMIFSVVRGVSLMYLQNAWESADENEVEENFRKAIALDPQEPLFRYSYGAQLFAWKRPAEAIPQIRFAIDKGIATSIGYFNLASAQIIARKNDEAELTFLESLRVYPRSIFLITAYASFLKENGKDSQAQNEYEKAFQINPAQAASWQIAETQGMKKLTQMRSRNNNLVEAMDLKPTEGIYALLDFQKQNNPDLVQR